MKLAKASTLISSHHGLRAGIMAVVVVAVVGVGAYVTGYSRADTPTGQGDVNLDGRADVTDLSIVMSEWGQKQTDAPADLNNDGSVTVGDLSILLSNWRDKH